MSITLNGKVSNTRPRELIALNGKRAIADPPILNGYMPTRLMINGYDRPPVFHGCILYLPLWHPKLSRQASIHSMDKYSQACSIVGTSWQPDGRVFDGIDDNINCGNPSQLNIGTSDFSVLVWLKSNSISSAQMLVNKTQDNTHRWYCSVTNSKLYYYNRTPADAYQAMGTTVLSSDIPYLYGLTNSRGSEILLYLNGVDDTLGEPPDVGDSIANTADLMVGKWVDTTSFSFAGCISEVVIYNRVLTPQEILTYYLATKWRYLC